MLREGRMKKGGGVTHGHQGGEKKGRMKKHQSLGGGGLKRQPNKSIISREHEGTSEKQEGFWGRVKVPINMAKEKKRC